MTFSEIFNMTFLFNPSHHIGHIPENANNWERDTMPLIYDNVVRIGKIQNIHIETIPVLL